MSSTDSPRRGPRCKPAGLEAEPLGLFQHRRAILDRELPILAANEYDGPAVVSVYMTCQLEHDVGDNHGQASDRRADYELPSTTVPVSLVCLGILAMAMSSK